MQTHCKTHRNMNPRSARYDQGESAYADYLTAQSARLNAALQALTADQTYMNATISIYKSLGVY